MGIWIQWQTFLHIFDFADNLLEDAALTVRVCNTVAWFNTQLLFKNQKIMAFGWKAVQSTEIQKDMFEEFFRITS